MEAQTVGLINSEGSTHSTYKSFCHAGALCTERLGLSSWIPWHLAPPQPVNHNGMITGLERDEKNIPQWLDTPLLSPQIK